ncbi:MAG: UxaA family hydrolase [Treponema sp.]|nr:UxaA family hydrolase [Treponema sp.]
MLDLSAPPEPGALHPDGGPAPLLPETEKAFFEGYAYTREKDGYGGARNILAIHATVQYVAGVLNTALRRIKTELLPQFPNVDDVIAANHTYGCSVAIVSVNSPPIRERCSKEGGQSNHQGKRRKECALGDDKRGEVFISASEGDQDVQGVSVLILNQNVR